MTLRSSDKVTYVKVGLEHEMDLPMANLRPLVSCLTDFVESKSTVFCEA